ncbi:MAG: peptide chain release factor N(5)-glutamine methyltransferase [Fibrobacterota bacterium]
MKAPDAVSVPSFRGLTFSSAVKEAQILVDRKFPETGGEDSLFLMSAAAGLSYSEIRFASGEYMSEEQALLFQKYLQKRLDGQPAQYITGETDFYGYRIRVSSGVLIPRPETELLADAVMSFLKDRRYAHCLDIFTGSGAVGIVCALKAKDSFWTLSDKSQEALLKASENVQLHGLCRRVHLYNSDLFNSFSSGRKWDLIAANPPYVSNEEMKILQPEVREHEPRIALDGGLGGMEIISRFLKEVSSRLFDGGRLYMEAGYGQADAVKKEAAKAGLDVLEVIKDYSGIERHFVMGKSC